MTAVAESALAVWGSGCCVCGGWQPASSSPGPKQTQRRCRTGCVSEMKVSRFLTAKTAMKRITCYFAVLAGSRNAHGHVDLRPLQRLVGCRDIANNHAARRTTAGVASRSQDQPVHRRPKPFSTRHDNNGRHPVSMSQFLIFGKDHQDNALKSVLRFLNKRRGRPADARSGSAPSLSHSHHSPKTIISVSIALH